MRRISAATPTQPLSRSSRTPAYASPMKSAATVRRSTSIPRSFVMGGRQLFPGGHAEAKGRRPTMEDACASCGEFAGPRTQYYGLFDGHGGKEVALTRTEYMLLLCLLSNRGKAMSRDQIIDFVWGTDHFIEANSVDVYVRYLRSKLDGDRKDGSLIKTLRGIGYIISTEEA